MPLLFVYPQGAIVMRLKHSAFLLIVITISLFLAEILARVLLPQPIPLIIPCRNFRQVYELNPQHRQINSLGMHDKEIDIPDLKNSFVIAVIGDSHTYSGTSNEVNKIFTSRLEYYLNNRKIKRERERERERERIIKLNLLY
jgi:hypothetical protein